MIPVKRSGSDTPREVEDILISAYRRMTPAQKLARVLDLNRTVALMSAARLRAQYGPALSDEELDRRLASLHLDRETMIRVFNWDPRKKGY